MALCQVIADLAAYRLLTQLCMQAPCSKSPNPWQALVYAAGMHLLVSSARHSCPSMVVGALVGLAYQTDFLGFKRLRVIPARLHLSPQSHQS